MRSLIAALVQEHRGMEHGLDRLGGAIAAGQIEPEMFRQVAALAARHYSRENEFLRVLEGRDSALAAKLRGQHEEALELAARIEEAFTAGDRADVLYLARRFAAIAQHNIIEEERDVFPLL